MDVPYTEGCIILSLTAGPLYVSHSNGKMPTLSLHMCKRVTELNVATVVASPFSLNNNETYAMASTATAKPTFNVEEEVVVIRNGWTPLRRRRRDSDIIYLCGLFINQRY